MMFYRSSKRWLRSTPLHPVKPLTRFPFANNAVLEVRQILLANQLRVAGVQMKAVRNG